MNISRIVIVLSFILIGVFSRLLPHPPNFTALNALALFGGLYFQNRWLSLIVVFSTLFFSDLIIGFHSTMPFVYLSFGLVTYLSDVCPTSNSSASLLLRTLCASLLFFVISNFGVWLTDSFYVKNLSGLAFCYLAAIPFLANQIAGDLIYVSTLLFCVHLVEQYISKKKVVF